MKIMEDLLCLMVFVGLFSTVVAIFTVMGRSEPTDKKKYMVIALFDIITEVILVGSFGFLFPITVPLWAICHLRSSYSFQIERKD
jgi:hypothetical protein